MSGTRRLTASRVELLADEDIVGPVSTSIVLSAPATTRLGNNPALVTFALSNTNLPATAGINNIVVNAVGDNLKYFSVTDTTIPYHSRLTPSVVASKARLGAIFGLGLKATVIFEGFALYGAALASPVEVTIGLHGADNLGNTWDKTATLLFNAAAGAAGKTFRIEFPILASHLPLRSSIDFYGSCDNPAAIGLGLSGMTITCDVQQ